MSAYAELETQVKDADILKKSLDDLKIEYTTNAKGIKFYGKKEGMDIDVYIPKYKFGFVKKADGKYDLVADSDYTKQYNSVKRKYAENIARSVAARAGFLISEVVEQPNGEVKLIVKRRAY